MRVAAIQLSSTPERDRNLDAASKLLDAAAKEGAKLIVLPEMFNVLGSAAVMLQAGESLEGPSMTWAKQMAKECGVWLVAGSFMEQIEGQSKHYNTSCAIDPSGVVRAVYRKIHLFDNEVSGAAYRESDRIMPGNDIVLAEVFGFQLGVSICYDLRFPELFRSLTLRGARMIALPSAFTEKTGRAHWEPLVRARAIENQVFMIAANQIGSTSEGLRWHGHSMIVDPWGTILAEAPNEETYILADLNWEEQDRVRTELPSLTHRRPDYK